MHKAQLAAVLLLIHAATRATVAVAAPLFEGQDVYAAPNCAIVLDHSRLFRDIIDPTFYWLCPEGQETADYLQCAPNYAFMEPLQMCVVWEEWLWFEAYTK